VGNHSEDMLRRTSFGLGLLVLLFVLPGIAEKTPPASSPSDLIELPVFMQQKVVAGITPVGTKVLAKLTISTLVHGTVIPKDSILSGEVTDSEAKSTTAPSRLGIRIDLAKWKNGSLPLKVYLTEWYYPVRPAMAEDGNPGYSAIHGSVGITMGGGNSYPSSTNPTATSQGGRRMPDDDPPLFPASLGTETPTTATNVSTHRIRMQNVELKQGDNGSFALTSKKNSLKLDKNTTYVLAAGDLLSPN